MDELWTMKPIGTLKSVFQSKNGTPRQSGLCSYARGSLTIDKSVFNNPHHSLEGLANFSHVWLIFVFHKNNNDVHSKAKVKPPRLNGRRTGVFSTRSPYRPNAIGLTLAKLNSVEGATINLTGIDMIDGTPILDIKPYIPYCDQPVCSDISAIVTQDCAEKQSSSEPHINVDNQSINSVTSSLPDHVDDSFIDSWANLSIESTTSSLEIAQSPISPKQQTQSIKLVDTSALDTDVQFVNKMETSPSHTCLTPSESYLSKDTTIASLDKTIALASDSVKRLKLPQEVVDSSRQKVSSTMFVYKQEVDAHDVDVQDDDASTRLQLSRKSQVAEHMDKMNGKVDGDMSDEIRNVDDSGCLMHQAYSLAVCRQNCHKNEEDFQTLFKSDSNVEMFSSKDESSSTSSSVITADWVINPSVSKLDVHFTHFSLEQLSQFSLSANDYKFKLIHLQSADDLQSAIKEVLHEDPRSVYRRKQCSDSLYYFTVDSAHVTCWFDGNRAEVVRVQPKVLVPYCC